MQYFLRKMIKSSDASANFEQKLVPIRGFLTMKIHFLLSKNKNQNIQLELRKMKKMLIFPKIGVSDGAVFF